MGIDHGAALIYGYEISEFKTYDDLTQQQQEKAGGSYPNGRDLLEKYMLNHDEITVSRNHDRTTIIGVKLASIYRTGIKEIKEEDLDQLNQELDEHQEKLENVANLKHEKPKLLLHSTLRG